MSEHTKEPWPFGATPISSKDEALALFKQSLDAHHGDLGGFFYEIFTEDGKRIAFLVGPSASANARRIVACVNACAGIPTDDLELCPNDGLLHLAAHANQLVKQRDELLAALEAMNRAYLLLMENGLDRISDLGGECDPVDVMERSDPALRESRAVIASVKGGAS